MITKWDPERAISIFPRPSYLLRFVPSFCPFFVFLSYIFSSFILLLPHFLPPSIFLSKFIFFSCSLPIFLAVYEVVSMLEKLFYWAVLDHPLRCSTHKHRHTHAHTHCRPMSLLERVSELVYNPVEAFWLQKGNQNACLNPQLSNEAA